MKGNPAKKETCPQNKYPKCTKDTIVRIGIVFFLAVFLAITLIIYLKYSEPVKPNPNINFIRLVWDSIISIPTLSVFLMDIIISTLLITYSHQLQKSKIVCMSILFFVIVTFDNIAIRYPLQQEWIALVNLAAIIICVSLVLLHKKEKIYISKGDIFSDSKITKVLGSTSNKKIIAVQLYKIETSQKIMSDHTERICFDVSHIGNDFVRYGNDVNSISHTTYELDRDIVDSFPIVLNLYEKFRNNGDEAIKIALLAIIDDKITILKNKLKAIETLGREVTKDDCCNARALTIYLSFKYILNHQTGPSSSQNNCIGEISLQNRDLNLKLETEDELFSLYRTGILGAALLNNNLRYIFHYRKKGEKTGRKYSVSQLICNTKEEKNGFSSQIMYICLFTIDGMNTMYIPEYMFESISDREKEITNILETLLNGGKTNV